MTPSTPLSTLKVVTARGETTTLTGWPAELVGLILVHQAVINATVYHAIAFILRKADRIATSIAGKVEVSYGPSRVEGHHTDSERIDLTEKR